MALRHSGTVTLETDRLLLRQFLLGDAQQVYDNWARDGQVTKFLSWPPHPNVEESKKVIQFWLDDYPSKELYNWAIVLKELGQPIGSIGVVGVKAQNLSCEVGYCIGREYWRKGIAAEALLKVLEYLLRDVGFNRIEAKHHVQNPASGRVMEKAGMVFEGRLRQAGRDRQGEFFDYNRYSILKSEWVGNCEK